MHAVSRLYGRRIRGDVGPLNIDPARRLPGRIFGPAVSLTGYMQDYDEASLVQHFELGSRMQLIRNRVFYYARVGENWAGPGMLTLTQMGQKNTLDQCVIGLPTPAGATTSHQHAGDTQVVVTVSNTTDGVLRDGVIGVNELVGGHIIIFPTGGGAGGLPRGINREIIANTATSAILGYDMTVTMDRPLPVDIALNSRAACMHSEYAAVHDDNRQWHPVVGIAMVSVAPLNYIWLQTWGPSWMSVQPTCGWPDGIRSNNMQVVFRADGSCGLHGVDAAGAMDPTTVYAQHAGYIMNVREAGGATITRGAPFVFLQITP